jgi:hypothetical protein
MYNKRADTVGESRFGSDKSIRRGAKVVSKMRIVDGRCEGSSGLWQRSNERLCPKRTIENSFVV